MSDVDDEPRNRSTTVAVIIAVVFLAVLGTGVGIVLGSTNKSQGDDVGSEATVTPSAEPTATGSADGGGGDGATRTRTPTGTKSYRPVAKDDCPQQTDEAAGTSLSVKLYIRTNSSEVWICEGGGRTVYQGHLNGRPFPSATSDYSLFLTSVRFEGGVYAATNANTTYFVSKERLRRERNNVEEANEPVVEFHGG